MFVIQRTIGVWLKQYVKAEADGFDDYTTDIHEALLYDTREEAEDECNPEDCEYVVEIPDTE